MPRKTRKHFRKYAKNGTKIHCKMKSCKAKKYAAIYGTTGGSTRSNQALFY
jgi:hypothetical protein